MRSFKSIFLACCIVSTPLLAQKGIGTNVPNPQAALDVHADDKGVLMPHISLTSSITFLGGITATASYTGMLVYNSNTSTVTGLRGTGYFFWNGTYWEKFIGDTDLFVDLDGDTQIQVEETSDDDVIRLDVAGVEVATFTSTQTNLNTAITASSTLEVTGNATVTSDLVVAENTTASGTLTVNSTTTLNAALVDVHGDAGTAGQLLSSTGTSTNWIDSALQEAPTLTGVAQLTDTGSLTLDGARDVFVQGDYAYVAANGDDGFQVIDISDPTNPTGVGQLTDDGVLELNGALDVFVQGNYAYVVSNVDDGFQVIDISDPANPTGVGQLQDNVTLELNGAASVFVRGNYAYVSSSADDGLQVIELGNNSLYGLEVGSLDASSLQVDNHAQFNSYVGVKGGLSVGASTRIAGGLSVGSTGTLTEMKVYGDALVTGNFETGGSISQTGTGVLHPDYVFEQYFEGASEANPVYAMPSLESVEAFVKANKHLPGVQSRAEIESKGHWNVSENVRTNLEKVEELYLHTIEQQKEIQLLKKSKNKLNQKVNALEQESSAMRKVLDQLLYRIATMEQKE